MKLFSGERTSCFKKDKELFLVREILNEEYSKKMTDNSCVNV